MKKYILALLILFNFTANSWLVLSFWIIMSFGMAGIGFSIMHDANHGAYSKNKKKNGTSSVLFFSILYK